VSERRDINFPVMHAHNKKQRTHMNTAQDIYFENLSLYFFLTEEMTEFETSYHFLEEDGSYISYHGNKEIKQEQH
jgi:hypothetical protein